MNTLLRIILSSLMIFLQIIFLFNDLSAATNSVEPGVVNTPKNQELNQSAKLPFIPGDAILLSTYPDTTSFLNGIYPIDDQGYIEFPIGDRIHISIMNEENFLNYLRDNYQNYVLSPNLSVKPMIRVTIVGGFLSPGMYYVDTKMSLWELIKLAGGLAHEKGLKEINWERNGEKVIEDITPYLERGISLNKMGFRSGDLVWAPSPDTEDTWEFVTTRVLPIVSFAASLYLMWVSYQTLVLIARR
jgi:protein involved in polysaccharide export with SLBB domain